MDFDAIERRRERVNVTRKALCEKAGVTATTYYRIQSGRVGGRAATFTALTAALDEIETALLAKIQAGGQPT